MSTHQPTHERKLQAHLRLPVHALQAILHMVPQHAAMGKQRGAHLGGGGRGGKGLCNKRAMWAR